MLSKGKRLKLNRALSDGWPSAHYREGFRIEGGIEGMQAHIYKCVFEGGGLKRIEKYIYWHTDCICRNGARRSREFESRIK